MFLYYCFDLRDKVLSCFMFVELCRWTKAPEAQDHAGTDTEPARLQDQADTWLLHAVIGVTCSIYFILLLFTTRHKLSNSVELVLIRFIF